MSHPLKHPKAGELLTRVAQYFKADDTYILHDSSIIFVCGGPMDSPSMRPRFSYMPRQSCRIFVFSLPKALRKIMFYILAQNFQMSQSSKKSSEKSRHA